MLSPYQTSPCQRHLEQLYHIFAYRKQKPKVTLYFDPSQPNIDPSWSYNDDPETFKDRYRDTVEELSPVHMIPEP